MVKTNLGELIDWMIDKNKKCSKHYHIYSNFADKLTAGMPVLRTKILPDNNKKNSDGLVWEQIVLYKTKDDIPKVGEVECLEGYYIHCLDR